MQKGTTKYTRVTKKAEDSSHATTAARRCPTQMKHGYRGKKSLLRKRAFADVFYRGTEARRGQNRLLYSAVGRNDLAVPQCLSARLPHSHSVLSDGNVNLPYAADNLPQTPKIYNAEPSQSRGASLFQFSAARPLRRTPEIFLEATAAIRRRPWRRDGRNMFCNWGDILCFVG